MSETVDALDNLFKRELIFLQTALPDLATAVTFAGTKMQALGLVKDSYAKAVIAREEQLPTGLKLGDFGVAIPHTDGTHVNQSAAAVLVFDKAIEVRSMINPDEFLDTKLVFLLAVKEPNGQVEVLRELMALFKNVNTLQKIEQAKDPHEVLNLINKKSGE